MKLIESNSSQCVLASFAMVMGTTMDDLIQKLGHDGLARIANQPEPFCFRSFHPEEFADLLVSKGGSMTMFSLRPTMQHGDEIVDHSLAMGTARFYESLNLGNGVLFGVLDKGVSHAVAWNHKEEKVYDPRGYTWRLSKTQDMSLRHFFLVQRGSYD